MPPQSVRPYVKTNKHDLADAEAICDAVTRAGMRFVPIKGAEQQGVLVMHRARELLIRQRTMLVNAVRAHLAEFGLIVPKGIQRLAELRMMLTEADEDQVPAVARPVLQMLIRQVDEVNDRLTELERYLMDWHRSSEASRRLAAVPGIGPITASAIVATVADAGQFRSARQFAAWLGLVPRQHSSGGRERLGGLSKRGDGYLRRLLVHGARAVIRWQRRPNARPMPWLAGLLSRRHVNVAMAALANKNARIAWALLSRRDSYGSARMRPAAA